MLSGLSIFHGWIADLLQRAYLLVSCWWLCMALLWVTDYHLAALQLCHYFPYSLHYSSTATHLWYQENAPLTFLYVDKIKFTKFIKFWTRETPIKMKSIFLPFFRAHFSHPFIPLSCCYYWIRGIRKPIFPPEWCFLVQWSAANFNNASKIPINGKITRTMYAWRSREQQHLPLCDFNSCFVTRYTRCSLSRAHCWPSVNWQSVSSVLGDLAAVDVYS